MAAKNKIEIFARNIELCAQEILVRMRNLKDKEIDVVIEDMIDFCDSIEDITKDLEKAIKELENG